MSKFEIKEHWSVRLTSQKSLRRAICLSDVRFSLAFNRQNLAFFSWNPLWNLWYIVGKTMFSLALSLPMDQSPAPYFGSWLNLHANCRVCILFKKSGGRNNANMLFNTYFNIKRRKKKKHSRRPRAGESAREKRREEQRQKSPLVPFFTRPFPKIKTNAGS